MSALVVARCFDAAVLASLHVATVTVAYRSFFPGSPPPAIDDIRAMWEARLSDPTAVAFAALFDGRPVGSVMVRADPSFPEGQLVGLHVLPGEWGHGTGGLLHDYALGALLDAGFHTAGLWVLAANERARRMYERRGWVLRPGVETAPDGVLEVRYRRVVGPDP